MPTYSRTNIALIAGTGLLVLAAATSAIAQAPSPEGVARISDRDVVSNAQPTAPSNGAACQSCQTCQTCQSGDCYSEGDCPAYVHEGQACHLTGNPVLDWCKIHNMQMRAAIVCQCYTLKAKCGMGDDDECKECKDGDCKGGKSRKHHRRGLFGCNRNDCNANGNCNGNGCQNGGCHHCGLCQPTGYCGMGTPVVDCYSMVYATLPEYADPRDGRVYSAEGFNVPVAMPLAPNVEHTYNYGWGIPSSRLTPISRFINETGVVPPPQYAR